MVKPTVKSSNPLIRNAFDAIGASTKGLNGVKPSTTGLAGERAGRNIKDITKALRDIEDGLKRLNAAKRTRRAADSASIETIKRNARQQGLKDYENRVNAGIADIEEGLPGLKITRDKVWDPLTKTFITVITE